MFSMQENTVFNLKRFRKMQVRLLYLYTIMEVAFWESIFLVFVIKISSPFLSPSPKQIFASLRFNANSSFSWKDSQSNKAHSKVLHAQKLLKSFLPFSSAFDAIKIDLNPRLARVLLDVWASTEMIHANGKL